MTDTSDAVLLARVTGSLLVVVLLALVVARFARRTTRGRGGDLVVRERVGLSRETAAVVLEADGRRLLVGITPTQVTLLADLTAGPLPGTYPAALPGTYPAASPGSYPAALPGTYPGALPEPLLGEGPAVPTPRAALGTTAQPTETPRHQQRHDLGHEPAREPTRRPTDGPAGEPPVRVTPAPLSRRVVRELDRTRRKAMPPTQRGSGSVLDPRTWQQGVEALRDLTARRG